MQLWKLERKIQVTQLRIMEWYERFEGKVYISFSGGKDSTVLLDLARRIYPDVQGVFVDTGLEYPEVRKFALATNNVVRLTPEIPFDEVIKKYGYPIISKEVSRDVGVVKRNPDCKTAARFDSNSPHIKKYGIKFSKEKWKFLIDAPFNTSNRCCDIMKKNPCKKFEHESGLHPIVATMAYESQQRKSNWLKSGCNAFDNDRPISQPMSFWLEKDVLEYLKTFSIPYASVYGDIETYKGKLHCTGEQRTGCMFCMYGCQLQKEPNKFQRMKITHPKQYDYCIRPVEEKGLGLGEVLDYIGVPYE